MDHEPATVVELEDDHFQEVAGPIGAEHERSSRLVVPLLEGKACNCVTDGVDDVRVGDPVFPRDAVNVDI